MSTAGGFRVPSANCFYGVLFDMTTCALELKRLDGPPPAGSQTIQYQSRGRLLIVADAPLDSVPLPADGLAEVTVLTARQPIPVAGPDSIPGVRMLQGRLMALPGWLGEFTAKIDSQSFPATHVDANHDTNELITEKFDLVIDLAETAALSVEQSPAGYFRAHSQSELEGLIKRCSELVGTFSKPRYFRYDESICAHESYGTPGCTRCLDVCSADAIVSEGSRIAVNPHLCQGCATCTLACPTGALSYVWPSRENLLRRVSEILQGASEAGATILVHRRNTVPDLSSMPGPVHSFPVEALPAMGEEIWFAALALGAGRVALLADGDTPGKVLELLSARVSLARQMLAVCDRDPDAIVLLRRPEDLAGLAAGASDGPVTSRDTLQPAIKYKRLLLNQALAALGGKSDQPTVPVEAGAPWGRIVIDPEKCTLCSACAEVCPSIAIRYFEDAESASAIIGFNEQRCIQCGICATACPEDAIELEPRYAGASESESWENASQGPLTHCTECQRTFIPQKLLEATLDNLRTKGKLSDDIEKQLRRCPACRAQHVHGR